MKEIPYGQTQTAIAYFQLKTELNCYWPSPTQLFLVLSYMRLMTICILLSDGSGSHQTITALCWSSLYSLGMVCIEIMASNNSSLVAC
jgi:hypothetical protein